MSKDQNRARFEKALAAMLIAEGYSAEVIPQMFERGSSGDYASTRIAGAWLGWNEGQRMVLSGCEFTQRELLERVMRNIEPRSRYGTPRWALVREAFGNGRGVSYALCHEFGYDADEYLSTDPNYAADQKVLAHLQGLEGSTAWAMSGAVGMEREDVSKCLYRLKRKGLVQTKPGLKAVWISC